MRRRGPNGACRVPRQRGFTLLEMMAVVLLTGIVLSAAVRFYVQLSIANKAALERVRGERRTVAILDRIARDLEGTVLVKRPESVEDPLQFPWLFLAADEGDFGATRLKFSTRARVPKGDVPESDFEVVSYWLAEGVDGTLDLLRWSSPHLPERLDATFPRNDDPNVAVLAHGVAQFGVRLTSETGEATAAWDSSQLVRSSMLPLAAEITLELYPENEDGTVKDEDQVQAAAADGEVPLPTSRWAFLRLRPIDLEAQRDPDGESDTDEASEEGEDSDGDGIPDDEEEDGDDSEACMTVGQCIGLNPGVIDSLPPETQATIQSMSGMCYRDVAGSLPIPVSGCE